MPMPLQVLSGLVLLIALAAPPAAAQEVYDWSDQIPAHAAVVDGAATLERDELIEPLALNTILVAGDRLRTDQGRVEILFSDGSVLDIDAFSSVDVLSGTLVRLLSGRVRLTVARSAGGGYRVDAPGGSADIRMAGEYRMSVTGAAFAIPQFELAVYRGLAELRNQLGTTIVRPGTYAVASSAAAPSLPYAANSATWDEFDAWSNEQRDARLGYTSAQYLPAELRSYGGELDRNGSWDYVAGYGQVWFPYVGVNWSPYTYGSWSVVGSFGWTWVGVDRWSWPTHHYGRWGHQSGRWFWIPGRQWAPAWVSWVSSPGYVAWSPLGYDNRPLVSITTVVNVGPRVGWTVVPTAYWRPRTYVAGVRVSHDRLRPEHWRQFTDRGAGPGFGDRGERNGPPPPAGPGPSTGARAVPRGNARAVQSPTPRPASPTRLTPSTPSRPTVRPSTTPARATTRDARTTSSVMSNPVRTPSRAQPSPPTRASSGVSGSAPPNVVYYRGRSTAAAEPPAASGSPGRTARPASPPGRSAAGVAPARTPAGSSRVMRSSPTGSAPSRGVATARPRSSPPAGVPSASRPAAPSSRVAPPRSSARPPSAQPSRGGGRGAPSGSARGGQARPRGGGQ